MKVFLNGDKKEIIHALEQYIPRSKAENLLYYIDTNCRTHAENYIKKVYLTPQTSDSSNRFMDYLARTDEILEELCEKTGQPQLKEFFQDTDNMYFLDVDGVRKGKIRMEFNDGTVIYFDDPAREMSHKNIAGELAKIMEENRISLLNVTNAIDGERLDDVNEIAWRIGNEMQPRKEKSEG